MMNARDVARRPLSWRLVLPPGFVLLDVLSGADGPLEVLAADALQALPDAQASVLSAGIRSVGTDFSRLPSGAVATDLVVASEKIAGARFPGSVVIGAIDQARLPIPPDVDAASVAKVAAAMDREPIAIDFHHGLLRRDVRVDKAVALHSLDYLVPVPEQGAWLAAFASAVLPADSPEAFAEAALVLLDSIMLTLRFRDAEAGVNA